MRGNDSSGLASSPRSSDEAASRHGSPDTKLTAFSPEDVGLKSRTDLGIGIDSRRDEPRSYYSM